MHANRRLHTIQHAVKADDCPLSVEQGHSTVAMITNLPYQRSHQPKDHIEYDHCPQLTRIAQDLLINQRAQRKYDRQRAHGGRLSSSISALNAIDSPLKHHTTLRHKRSKHMQALLASLAALLGSSCALVARHYIAPYTACLR